MALPPIICLENVHYSYRLNDDQVIPALAGLDLAIQPGEYVVILGHNGSGKSTLAKHLNGLLLPDEGEVWVKAWNTKDRARIRDVRSTVGMVFQSPDNQIVATIVEEDVAFGPENLGLPHPEIVRRVDWSLTQVGMQPFRQRPPHLLSSGQKQRICIAGVLAMAPEVLVLDESTAMLDPLGRREVLEIVRKLNREQGVTIIAITHLMEEAVAADRVVVMEAGRITLQGSPQSVFSQTERLRALRMDVPPVTRLAQALHQRVADFPPNILTAAEFVAAVSQRTAQSAAPPADNSQPLPVSLAAPPANPIIQLQNITHFYMRGTPLQVKAIHDIDLEVYPGEILGIIGHTGSGKSTIMQHLNALLRPHTGRVLIFGQDVNQAGVDVKNIRARIGLVFQQPENQLFEQYVGDDVAYGPRNLNLSKEAVRARVKQAMELVGLDFTDYKDRLTFGLSGGQMRRVALAGVLALEPEVLVLDEPTTGLDPQSRRQLLEQILALRHERTLTLVLVSHNMEELAQLCERICVVNEGGLIMTGSPAEIFAQPQILRDLGLDVPTVTDIMDQLHRAGVVKQTGTVLTIEHAVKELAKVLAGGL